MTTGGSTPQRLGRTAALGVSLQLTVRIVGVAATLVAVVASLALVVLVVGLLWFPACARSLRAQVLGIARVQARATGQQLPVPTLPDITPPAPGDSALRTALRDTVALVTNRATWRLLLWALLESCLGVVLAVLPIGLVGWGIDGLLVMPLLHLVLRLEPNEWYAFVPVSSPSMVPVASLLGLVFIALGWLTGPWWVRLHGRWCTVLLAPGEEELRARVEELTVSRTEIRDDAAAELRRLEREVHDGTQSQLVAIGLTLGTAEAMLETDPDRARELIEQAREESSLALSDLRGLMRGIRPPILADRGSARH
ncbi:histidine kinase [Salana multivorans]